MTLQEQIQAIDRLKKEIEALRPLSPELERRIMDKFRLDWTYHSNAIEGNSLTYGETKAFLLHGITAAGKPFRDYLDIKGHHKALDTLQEIVLQQEPLTEITIRGLHEIILGEPYYVDAITLEGLPTTRLVQPGQYKTEPNAVKTSTGEIHYYVTPQQTPARMGDLMTWYRQEWKRKELHPLILAATFHYSFVIIHPFDDGNGRMSRLLMNLMLMQAGFPPVIIPKEIKNEYLLALEKADSDEDLGPFISLVGDRLIASMQLYLRGAKGEPIEDMDDLDKKLALLKKRLETELALAQKEREIVAILDIYPDFIKPFLEKFLRQCVKFNREFISSNFHIVHHESGESWGSPTPFLNPLEALQAFEELLLGNVKIIGIGLQYKWSGYANFPQIEIGINLSLRVTTEGNIHLIYYVSPPVELGLPSPQENLDEHYLTFPFEKLIMQIPDQIYQTIEKAVDFFLSRQP